MTCLLECTCSSEVSVKQSLQPETKDHDRSDRDQQSSPLGDNDYLELFGQPIDLLREPLKPPSFDQALEAEEPFKLSSSCLLGDNVSLEMSLAELREDMQNTRIPSSTSPSPIKVRSNATSPDRHAREASKMLQESITSLLGKRMSMEEAGNGDLNRPKRPKPVPSIMPVSDVGIHRRGLLKLKAFLTRICLTGQRPHCQ